MKRTGVQLSFGLRGRVTRYYPISVRYVMAALHSLPPDPHTSAALTRQGSPLWIMFGFEEEKEPRRSQSLKETYKA